jgi:DNA repair protein RecN (Recombination protein N)
MLHSLCIDNYALIERLELEWSAGLTAMTGETGSGKSIVLGALGLVLGDRAEVTAVRSGSSKCTVEATFSSLPFANDWLRENELETWSELILRREVTDQGRSRAFINDTPVSVAQLKAIGELLVDMHGQDSTRLMLRRDYQIRWLDSLGSHTPLLQSYQLAFTLFKEHQSTLSELEIERSKPQTDRDYLSYQLEELATLELATIDWDTLKDELSLLENSASIQEQLHVTWSALAGDSDSNNVLSAWAHGKKALIQAASLFPPLQELVDRMESLDVEIKDVVNDLESRAASIENNPARLQQLQRRFHDFQRISLKHHAETASELIQLEHSLQEQIDKTADLEGAYQNAKDQLEASRAQLLKLGLELMHARQAAAKNLEVDVLKHLVQMKMPDAVLQFELSPAQEPDQLGIEQVQLLFSANPGAKIAPLEQVASGGEKSRLMLAFKAAQTTTGLPTIILDEIDTGVSGDVADKMAKMMRLMAKNQQVISITHLPQVAAQSDQHYQVAKHVSDAVTRTHVVQLNGEERVLEIAALLSGETISDAARANAEALLAQR